MQECNTGFKDAADFILCLWAQNTQVQVNQEELNLFEAQLSNLEWFRAWLPQGNFWRGGA